jgi:hypothetical protein
LTVAVEQIFLIRIYVVFSRWQLHKSEVSLD